MVADIVDTDEKVYIHVKSVIVLSAIEMITYSWSPTQSHMVLNLVTCMNSDLSPERRED